MHANCRTLRITAACAALLVAFAAAAEGNPQGYEFDAGFDVAPQSLYWYSETVVALSRDMSKSGFLLRMYGSLAIYEYAAPAGIGSNIDGELWQFDLMPGYQFVRGSETFGGHVGLDLQDSQLDPDDRSNPVRGTAAGVKVEGHYYYYEDDKQPFQASLTGEYSTAFDTYYAEVRLGARVLDKLVIGPDASVDGDTGYNAQRLGGFAKYSFELTESASLELTAVAGHQFVSGDGNAGPAGGVGTFGTLELSTDF